jgi:hypothetical protein
VLKEWEDECVGGDIVLCCTVLAVLPIEFTDTVYILLSLQPRNSRKQELDIKALALLIQHELEILESGAFT